MSDELRPMRERLHLPFWHRADIEQELSSHLDEVVDELRAQGVEPEKARRAAAERLGDPISLGDELQAVHHGWRGGATVRMRLAKLLVPGVAVCVLLGGWFNVVREVVRVSTNNTTVSAWGPLEHAARDAKDPASFSWVISEWQRARGIPVVWSGIVDHEGHLVWGDTKGLPLGKPFPEAMIFMPRGISRTGQVNCTRRGGRKSPGFAPLVERLDAAGVHAKLFYGQPLGEGAYTGNPIGLAVIALGEPLWGERLLAMVTNSTFWYGLLWLLSAAAIFAHRRYSDPWGARIWGVFAILVGPIAWLPYVALVRLGYFRRPDSRLLQRATLLPAIGLVATLLMLARPTSAVPAGWLDMYAFQPDRGAETLAASEAGRRLLFVGARAGDPRVRQAAIRQLARVAGTVKHVPQFTSSWLWMLKSEDPALNEVGRLALYVMSNHCGDRVNTSDLVEAWKVVLGSDNEEIRKNAWANLSGDIRQKDTWVKRLRSHMPELLALAKEHPEVRSHWYYNVLGWAIREGVPNLDPDDYGIPRERQQGLLPVAGGAFDFGDTSIGETRDGSFDLQAREQGAKLPVLPYRVTTSSPSLEAWVTRWPDKPDSPPILYFAFTASGPEGKHEEWIYLTGGNGSRIGVFSVVWTETTQRVRHCPMWEASRPQREARLARLRATGKL